MSKEPVAVVGIGQTKHVAARRDVSIAGLVREAARRALDDAELTWADIDAVVIGKAPDFFEGVMMPELFLADALGSTGKPMFRVHTAGSGEQGLLEGDRQGQAPHGVGLGLLLEGEGEDGGVHPGRHQVRGDQRRRSADRARRVDPHHRLADRAEGVGKVQLGHHDALEEVGRLADHHGVDVVERRPGIGERPVDRLAHEAVHRHVMALGDVLGLPGSQHRGQIL